METINSYCTYLFAFELIIKIISKGLSEFLRDRFNHFDALIVSISLVELVLSDISTFNTALFRLWIYPH